MSETFDGAGIQTADFPCNEEIFNRISLLEHAAPPPSSEPFFSREVPFQIQAIGGSPQTFFLRVDFHLCALVFPLFQAVRKKIIYQVLYKHLIDLRFHPAVK